MINKFNKINKEIKHYGLLSFTKTKLKEHYYKGKFKKLDIQYSFENTPISALNSNCVYKDAMLNEATAFYAIKKGFDICGINYADICLLDIGCGYGKALNFGILLKFKAVTGIELDPFTFNQAVANADKMKINGYNTSYNIHLSDASLFPIPDGVNIIFMANPFGFKTMETVVNNIMRYRYQHNNELFVVYSVPVFKDLFERNKCCTKIFESFNSNKKCSEMAIYKIGIV